MRKQKIPITALSMPENIPGIEYKWLRNRWMLSFNNKITIKKIRVIIQKSRGLAFLGI